MEKVKGQEARPLAGYEDIEYAEGKIYKLEKMLHKDTRIYIEEAPYYPANKSIPPQKEEPRQTRFKPS